MSLARRLQEAVNNPESPAIRAFRWCKQNCEACQASLSMWELDDIESSFWWGLCEVHSPWVRQLTYGGYVEFIQSLIEQAQGVIKRCQMAMQQAENQLGRYYDRELDMDQYTENVHTIVDRVALPGKTLEETRQVYINRVSWGQLQVERAHGPVGSGV